MTAVVACAAGPSYTAAQAALVDAAHAAGKIRLGVVNRMWEWHPRADLLYAADPRWWKAAEFGGRALREFGGEMWTNNLAIAAKLGLCHQPLNMPTSGLPRAPVQRDAGIDSGGNGGYQLLGLLFKLLRLRDAHDPGPLVLVGYDLQHTGGLRHSHEDYGKHQVDGRDLQFSNASGVKGWIKNFDGLAREMQREGMRVINCTSATALRCFERADLATTLESL